MQLEKWNMCKSFASGSGSDRQHSSFYVHASKI